MVEGGNAMEFCCKASTDGSARVDHDMSECNIFKVHAMLMMEEIK